MSVKIKLHHQITERELAHVVAPSWAWQILQDCIGHEQTDLLKRNADLATSNDTRWIYDYLQQPTAWSQRLASQRLQQVINDGEYLLVMNELPFFPLYICEDDVWQIEPTVQLSTQFALIALAHANRN